MLHEVAHQAGRAKSGACGASWRCRSPAARLNCRASPISSSSTPGADGETAFPVEYKRGKPKPHRADEVQLCAQALCLEEMTGTRGARRRAVLCRDEAAPRGAIRCRVARADRRDRAAVRRTHRAGPHAAAGWHASRCRACSLIELCRPKAWRNPRSASASARSPPARSRHAGRAGVVKKLLNTLYVTTEGAWLRKDGENFVAEVDGAERARVPLHMLGSVVFSARSSFRRR